MFPLMLLAMLATCQHSESSVPTKPTSAEASIEQSRTAVESLRSLLLLRIDASKAQIDSDKAARWTAPKRPVPVSASEPVRSFTVPN